MLITLEKEILLNELIDIEEYKDLKIKFIGIATHSSQVKKGYLFIAEPSIGGNLTNKYIKEAIMRGAKAVLALPNQCKHFEDNKHVFFIESDNPRKIVAEVASKVYPKQPRNLIAITGTNGKTSVVSFLRQIWSELGYNNASLGTLGLGLYLNGKFKNIPFDLTTPEAFDLYKMINQMTIDGVDHLAIEASTHGISQHRLDYLKLTSAAFTNLTQDHLDYHSSFDDYFNTKCRLFSTLLPEGSFVVLNADVPEYNKLKEICFLKKHKVISYGKNGEVVKLIKILPYRKGQAVKINIEGKVFEFNLQLLGEFQVYNILCVIGLLIIEGLNIDTIIPLLNKLKEPKGRLELVGIHKSGAPVYIDYAHTPDALKNILKSLRCYVKGRLILVFGCGGDRDKYKRPIMGKIANDYADKVFITDDNPRYEQACVIRSEIKSSCPNAIEIGDRYQAICEAINQLNSNDLLIIAGKGHEQTQIISGKKKLFSDKDIALSILRK